MAMCKRGYNREEGYSIWRNNVGDRGICKICLRRAQEGRDPIPWPKYEEEVPNEPHEAP